MLLDLAGVYLEITSKCNRNCPYCYNDSTDKGTFLNKKQIYDVVDECIRKKIGQITLSGGEPFLHPDIFEIIRYINDNGMKAKIITNLTLLSSAEAIDLLRIGNFLQITVDSVYPPKNDLTRGCGSFKLIESLLKNVYKNNLQSQVHLRMNVSRYNFEEIPEYISFAKKYGFHQAAAMLIVKSGRGLAYDGAFDYKESILEISELVGRMEQIRRENAGEFDFSYSNLQDQRGCAIFSKDDISSVPRIDSEGNVYFCSFFAGKENCLGNISNNSIEEILNSSSTHKFIDKVRNRKNNEKCKECSFTKFCMCGCPAVSYMHTNSINESSDQCDLIKFFLKQKMIGII